MSLYFELHLVYLNSFNNNFFYSQKKIVIRKQIKSVGDHEIEINDGILIQLFSSYEILKYLDITLGINWIMFTIEDKKVSYSDYRLDPREEGIIWSPSLGFSIVFWF